MDEEGYLTMDEVKQIYKEKEEKKSKDEMDEENF